MNFRELIKIKRVSLGESQEMFGKRFGVGDTAVSFWESGKREAPYEVLSFVLAEIHELTVRCDRCGGTGVIIVDLEALNN